MFNAGEYSMDNKEECAYVCGASITIKKVDRYNLLTEPGNLNPTKTHYCISFAIGVKVLLYTCCYQLLTYE